MAGVECNVVCPYCKAEHDMATELRGKAKPSQGDVSVCINCGNISLFAMTLRPVTDEELRYVLQHNPELPQMQRMIRMRT